MSTATTRAAHKKAHTKSNSAKVAATSKTWDVTNSTATDLVVIDAFLSDPTSTDELYQRSLGLLSATDGQQLIKAGETKTISLSEAHTGSDSATVDYTVIIARADNLFPVKIVDLPASDDNENFSATTVLTADASGMKKAETFQQAISAFPSSDMATRFNNVLSNPDEQKIAAFFKGYPQYSAINLDMVTAVQTYYNRYGFVWAGYAGSKTYYLYTSDETKNTALGSISVHNQTIAPVINLEAPAGFTISYTDAKGATTPLYYSNGQITDDASSSTPRICLQGLFTLKSQLTGRDTDNQITTVLYGVINDTEVFGYNLSSSSVSELPTFKASALPDVNTLLHPQDVAGWLKLGTLLVGALAAVGVLAVSAYFIIKAIKNSLNPSPEEIRRRARERAQKIVDKMDPELKRKLRIPDDLSTATSDIKKQVSENLLKDSRRKMGDIMNKQLDTCKRLYEYGNTPAIAEVLSNTKYNLDVLPEAYPTELDLGQKMSGFMDDIANNSKLLSERVKTLGKTVSKANADAISEAKRTADDLTKRVTENEKIRESFEENEIPDFIEE